MSVYAIDPGGLAPYALDGSFVIPSKVTMYAPDPARAANAYIDRNYQWKRQLSLRLQSSLTELAEATGGKVFVNTNDIRGAIRSSFEDSRVTYTLGFYSRTSGGDGSFHPIKVKLPGREHLSVRYRDGYFEPEAQQRDGHRWEAERWNGQIEISLFQRDRSGNTYEPLTRALGLKLRQESYDLAVKNGFLYERRFKVDPKATSLRVIVRDIGSGNLGTLTIPLAGGSQ